MKKYLIAFLLSLSCAFTIAAVGCNNETPSVSLPPDSTAEEDSTGDSSDGTTDGEDEFTGKSTVSFTETYFYLFEASE